MRVDGIEYVLQLDKTGQTTRAYKVMVSGEAVTGLFVVEHFGRKTRDQKWTIIVPNGGRFEYSTQPELFEKIARLVHG